MACLTTPVGTLIAEGTEAERLSGTYDRLRKQADGREDSREYLDDLIECLE